MSEPLGRGLHPSFPAKMPFEDKVREYIEANPGRTVGDCADALGISPGAVAAACASLVDKGAAEWAPGDGEE